MLPSTFMVPFSSIRVKKNEQNLIGAAPSIVPLATKCLQNLLRDSTLSVISIAKKNLFKYVSIILKMPSVYFFIDHPIITMINE